MKQNPQLRFSETLEENMARFARREKPAATRKQTLLSRLLQTYKRNEVLQVINGAYRSVL